MKTTFSIIVSGLALFLASCSKTEVKTERPTPVEVQTVRGFDGKDEKRFSAVIQPYEQVDLSFRVGGYVDVIAQKPGVAGRSRPLQDGDRVGRGAVLARLHATDYEARTQQAKASLTETESLLAKAELDKTRAVNLYNLQSMTKPEYDAAISNYEATQARLNSARSRLAETATSYNDTVLRAPFAATVLKRNIATGTLAAPGAPAFILADTTVMKAVFGVPDKLMPRMKIGDTLALRADGFLNSDLHGKVTRVAVSADPKTRVFDVEVSIPNPKDELKVGMITTLLIEEAVPEIGSPVVPIGALVSSTKTPGGYAVYIAAPEEGGNVARLVDVEVGRTLGNMIVLKSGAKIGDQIVTTGAGLLHDGEPIEVVVATPTTIAQK